MPSNPCFETYKLAGPRNYRASVCALPLIRGGERSE
jgi:hypothetical protein